jgi:sensor histidine kinase regulating citrate/malate metabolism
VSIEEGSVSLTSVVRGSTFILNVKNRINIRLSDFTEEGIPYSSKKEDGHGYGLKNIRNIAHRYNGEIEIRQDETDHGPEFILNVMMIG